MAITSMMRGRRVILSRFMLCMLCFELGLCIWEYRVARMSLEMAGAWWEMGNRGK